MCETTECIPLWWSVLSAINKHQDQWGMQNHDDSCIWMRTFQSCGTGFGSGPWQRSVCFKSHAWHATGVSCLLSVLLYKTRVFSRRPTYGDGVVELFREATASSPMRCESDGSTCSSVSFVRHLALRQQRVSPPIAPSWTTGRLEERSEIKMAGAVMGTAYQGLCLSHDIPTLWSTTGGSQRRKVHGQVSFPDNVR
jgi:hypothetical protein